MTGASSGIGRSVAERFAVDGASVAIRSHEQDNGDSVAGEIEETPDV